MGSVYQVSLKMMAFFLQIQFREKVLWTAITLFIFLVCCQVGKPFFRSFEVHQKFEPQIFFKRT